MYMLRDHAVLSRQGGGGTSAPIYATSEAYKRFTSTTACYPETHIMEQDRKTAPLRKRVAYNRQLFLTLKFFVECGRTPEQILRVAQVIRWIRVPFISLVSLPDPF